MTLQTRRCAGSALVALVVVAAAVTLPIGHGFVLKRSAMNRAPAVCQDNAPCGWSVYDPVNRTPVEYLEVCSCPEGTSCRQDRDDVAISCYVYSCQPVGDDLAK